MQVYMVEATHFRVPGSRVAIHRTEAGAAVTAAQWINEILCDCRKAQMLCVPIDATALRFADQMEWLEEKLGEEGCHVDISDHELVE